VADHKNSPKGTERAKMMSTPSGKIEFISTFPTPAWCLRLFGTAARHPATRYAQNVVNDKTSAPTFKKRAQIILALDTNAGEPATQAEIARRVGVSAPTIFNTIKAFSEEGLEAIPHFKTPMEPNRKPMVTGEIEARIMAIARGAPPEGFGRWTVRSLTNQIELDIVPGISRETVRRVLKNETQAPPKKAVVYPVARSFAQRLAIHYTPKHGSWLNVAEIELSAMTKQCLGRRIPNLESVTKM
jgi:transposase